MRAEGEAGAPRVLLVADLEPAERGVAEALTGRGLRVRSVTGAAQGVRLLRSEGADVVVLALPLGGVDPIAACAALKEGPYAPALVLADAADQTAALSAALPDACRPDARASAPPRRGEARHRDPRVPAGGNARERGERARSGSPSPSCSSTSSGGAPARCSSCAPRASAPRSTCASGDPIFAEGGSLQETLGRQLVRRGAIGQDDYVRVVERMTEGVIHHQSLRLGEVLVELGLLTPAEVYDALALQVREKIVACFQWESFAYELHEALDEPEDLGIYQCPPTEALVLAGHPRALRPRAPRGGARGARGACPRAADERRERSCPLFQPTPAEQKLLRAIDGTPDASPRSARRACSTRSTPARSWRR